MLTVDFDRLGLRPGDRVLDMGCGAGRHAFEMYRRGADVIAFDQDADELATVRELFAAMSEAGEVPDGRRGRRQGGRRARAALRRRRVRPDRRGRGARAHPRRRRRDQGAGPGAAARAARWRSRCRAGCPRSSTGSSPTTTTTPRAATSGSTPARSWSTRSPRPAGSTTARRATRWSSTGKDYAHGLHTPYWWIKCAVGVNNDDHPLAKAYHRLLVWEIMKQPQGAAVRRQGPRPADRQEHGALLPQAADAAPDVTDA